MADSPGLHATLIYRFGSWVNRTFSFRVIRAPFKLIYGVLDRVSVVLWGIHIDDRADIGPGLYIAHPGGILVGPVRMGKDCNIAHHVTIGRRVDLENGVPTFGDRVWIGTQSVVFGGIRIGDGVTIGPLTVVARNLPARALVMGNPMRVLRLDYDNSAEIYGAGRQQPEDDAASPVSFKRRWGIAAINAATTARSIFRLKRSWEHEVRILAYHRVLDIRDDSSFEFDPDLVSASVDDFEWQIRHVRERYDPITFHHLVEFIEKGTPLPACPVIVTFDDGFDDNYRHAFPVLRSLNMPATFFVSTGYIGQRQTFWFDWFFYLCRQAAERRHVLKVGGALFPFDRDNAARQVRSAMRALWTLSDDERRIVVAGLAESLDMKHPDQGFAQSMPLDWDQVEAMAAAGMEFGSHTVSHPVLSRVVNDVDLRYELTESKRVLEQRLARTIDALAYPVGREFAFNDKIEQATRDAGYRIAVSYAAGTNKLRQLDAFKLKRIHVERYVNRAEFAATLAAPALLG